MFGNVINIKIANSSGDAKTYSVFGYNNQGDSYAPGSPPIITATPRSMGFAARESSTNPYVARRLRLRCSNTNQWDNGIIFQGIRGSSLTQWQAQPLDNQPPSNRISTVIDMAIPPFVIGPSLGITGTIEGNTTLYMIIEYNHLYSKLASLFSYLTGTSAHLPGHPLSNRVRIF